MNNVDRIKELANKSPLELEAWEIDALQQIVLYQQKKIEVLKNRKMTGKEIVSFIEEWLNKQCIHPDDLDTWFAHELLAQLEEEYDKGGL